MHIAILEEIPLPRMYPCVQYIARDVYLVDDHIIDKYMILGFGEEYYVESVNWHSVRDYTGAFTRRGRGFRFTSRDGGIALMTHRRVSNFVGLGQTDESSQVILWANADYSEVIVRLTHKLLRIHIDYAK